MIRQDSCPLSIMPTPRKITDFSLQSLSCPVQNTAEVRTSAPNANNPASEPVLKDQATMPGEALLENIPNWADWNKRHSVSLFKAICLVHNITPNRDTYVSLRERDDGRTSRFQSHLNTLKDNVLHNPALIVESSELKTKPTNNTKIILKPFIDWVQKNDPFPGLLIPIEFFAINPLIPIVISSPTTRQALTESADVPAIKKASAEASTVNIKLNKRWAQIMIAMAVKNYDFLPIWPTSELLKSKRVRGLYGPVSELCEQYGLWGSTDRTTVRDAFLAALNTLGEKAVMELIRAINEEKKSA